MPVWFVNKPAGANLLYPQSNGLTTDLPFNVPLSTTGLVGLFPNPPGKDNRQRLRFELPPGRAVEVTMVGQDMWDLDQWWQMFVADENGVPTGPLGSATWIQGSSRGRDILKLSLQNTGSSTLKREIVVGARRIFEDARPLRYTLSVRAY